MKKLVYNNHKGGTILELKIEIICQILDLILTMRVRNKKEQWVGHLKGKLIMISKLASDFS